MGEDQCQQRLSPGPQNVAIQIGEAITFSKNRGFNSDLEREVITYVLRQMKKSARLTRTCLECPIRSNRRKDVSKDSNASYNRC